MNVHQIIVALTNDEATRKNIPTAEYQSVMAKEQEIPIRVAYERPTATWTRNWSGAPLVCDDPSF